MSKTDTRPLIAKVKIGQKQLGLDEATYRAMLFEITGKESAALCNQVQLARVIDHMASKGAVFSAKGKKGDQPYRTGAARGRPDFYEVTDGVPFGE